MAYLRGENYLWSDEQYLHIWVADGQDAWEDTGWHEGVKQRRAEFGFAENEALPDGVQIPIEIMYQYVMMRFAQLVYDKESRRCHSQSRV